MRYLLIFIFLPLSANASIFGEENIALLKLVAGQMLELKRLAESVGIAKDSMELLIKINEGMERATKQLDAIDTVVYRAQRLDPSSIKRVSEITNMIYELKSIKASTEEIIAVKLILSDKAVAQSAVQSETAYKMGQEMIGTGAILAGEVKTASPGRASQIAANAEVSSMLSNGVMLQTLAQMSQLQAMSLELQKTQMERDLNVERERRIFLSNQLKPKGRNL